MCIIYNAQYFIFWRQISFKSAGSAMQSTQLLQHLHPVFTQQLCCSIYREQVISIECAYHPEMCFLAINSHDQSGEVIFQHLSFYRSRHTQAVSMLLCLCILQHHHTTLVIGIGECESIGGETVEKTFLYAYIFIKRLVIIKMVVGDICKHTAGKTNTSYTMLVYCM